MGNGFVLIFLLLLIASIGGIAAAIVIPVVKSRRPWKSVLKNAWVKVDGNWYYVDEDGIPQKDRWIETDAGISYVNSDGIRLTDTSEMIDGKQCRFDDSGYCISRETAERPAE